ncbi:MAG: hypothetical protein JJ966_12640 [Balneolaceae bacterium]|nr:hypothetical protein [Balneolaceae bacterium]
MRIIFIGLIALIGATSLQAQTDQIYQKQQKLLEYSVFQAQPDVVKKPSRAVLISVGATLGTFIISPILLNNDVLYPASLFTVLALYSFAPGAGYLYINDRNQFFKGGIQRGLSILAMGTGGLIVLISYFEVIFSEDDNPNTLVTAFGYGLMLYGLGFYVYTSFRDFIGVHRDTKRYNEERNLSLKILPVIDPVHSVYGAGLQLRF